MSETNDLEEFLEHHPEWRAAPDLLLHPPTDEEILSTHPDVSGEMLRKAGEMMRHGYTRGAFYMLCRERGNSSSMAEMLSLQRTPGLDTDDVFFSGQKPLYDQFGSQRHLDRYLDAAKKRGFRPNPQSTYFPNLARFPGDPEAFVTRAQGRSYIRKVLEKRGWGCDGGIKMEGREPEEDPHDIKNRTLLGEDIVREKMQGELTKNPRMSKKERRELREKIIDRHAPKV